jgi:hypothetical protein
MRGLIVYDKTVPQKSRRLARVVSVVWRGPASIATIQYTDTAEKRFAVLVRDLVVVTEDERPAVADEQQQMKARLAKASKPRRK